MHISLRHIKGIAFQLTDSSTVCSTLYPIEPKKSKLWITAPEGLHQ